MTFQPKLSRFFTGITRRRYVVLRRLCSSWGNREREREREGERERERERDRQTDREREKEREREYLAG